MTEPSAPQDESQDGTDDAAFEQAAVWLARLREPEPDARAKTMRLAEFEAWLAADPRNGEALAKAERLWGRLELPARRLAATTPARPANRRIRPAARLLALVACLFVLVTAGPMWWDEAVVRLESDHMAAVGGRRTIDLVDGSHVTLNTGAAIAVDMTPEGRNLRLLRGEAWFDVATVHRLDTLRRRARHRHAVQPAPGPGRRDGRQPGRGRGGRDPGQIRAPAASRPGPGHTYAPNGFVRPPNLRRHGRDRLAARSVRVLDAPLGHVVRELNRYRRGRIVLAGGGLAALKVSGVFSTDDPDAALRVIVDTLPVRATRLTDLLVLQH